MASPRYPSTGLWFPGVNGNYFSTPHQSSFNVTNLDIRCLVRSDNYSTLRQNFIGVWDAGNLQRSFQLGIDVNSTINFQISTDGTSGTISGQSATYSQSPGTLLWFRATYVASTGIATLYTGAYTGTTDSSGVTWVQKGSGSVGGTNRVPFATSTAIMEIGTLSVGTSVPMSGYIYACDVRNNTNDDGTGKIATPDFTIASSSPFTDSSGNVWTLNTSGTRPAKFVKRS